MSDPPPHTCPHCGSYQLIKQLHYGRVVVYPNGKRIPLETAHYRLNHPVIETHSIRYRCVCSWSGSEMDRPQEE